MECIFFCCYKYPGRLETCAYVVKIDIIVPCSKIATVHHFGGDAFDKSLVEAV